VAKYSAQLVAKSSENRNVTTTLSNVNPETAPVKIKQFAQTLNALTTNTYNETNYIVTTNLDTETPPVDTRQTPTFEFGTTIRIPSSADSTMPTSYTTNSDGTISFAIEDVQNVLVGIGPENGTPAMQLYTYRTKPATGTVGKLTVRIEGTDTFKPFEKTYDVTF
jgi:hypothetical protein